MLVVVDLVNINIYVFMDTGDNKLENVLKMYIDISQFDYFRFSNEPKNPKRPELIRSKLIPLLQSASVETRFHLVVNVRGLYKLTVLHQVARYSDLEITRYLLDGISSTQKYDLLKTQLSDGSTPLHFAAYCGKSSMITYLLTDRLCHQNYEILKIQDDNEDTALHMAAYQKNLGVAEAILSAVSIELQVQLLNIKNKKGQTATDVCPEIAVVPNQGNSKILPVLSLELCCANVN